jgi:hypothetical protein
MTTSPTGAWRIGSLGSDEMGDQFLELFAGAASDTVNELQMSKFHSHWQSNPGYRRYSGGLPHGLDIMTSEGG